MTVNFYGGTHIKRYWLRINIVCAFLNFLKNFLPDKTLSYKKGHISSPSTNQKKLQNLEKKIFFE